MEDQLIEIITASLLAEGIITASTPADEIPIFRQGSLGEAEVYPETFCTFWGSSEAEATAYDNDTATVVWNYQANAYSTSPATVYSLTNTMRARFKANGWQTPDRGHDVASDEKTHTGRGINVTYLKTYTPNEAAEAATAEPSEEPGETTTNEQEENANG